MKNFFNKKRVELIASEISDAVDTFNADLFIKQACKGLNAMELKARSKHIAHALMMQFPVDTKETYSHSIKQLLLAMGAPEDDAGLDGMEGFHHLPYLDFVELYGLSYPTQSLKALERMTQFFSAEFAIRPFLIDDSTKTLQQMKRWSEHRDWRVRRLASEGTRPRLPWGKQIPHYIKDPSDILPILNTLYDDTNLVVRRSVANNLNDISKDHPELAATLAATWLSNDSEDGHWSAKHGLRTLIKQGNPTALHALGYSGGKNITATVFKLTPTSLSIGEKLTIDFNLYSAEKFSSKLVIDYVLERVLANDKLAKKVFKIANTTMEAGQCLSFTKHHNFTQRSTRTYYPGTHTIHLQVNGLIIAHCTFELTN
ncbi:MAG: 3-methyladenine DNA glycosylase AlkC [Granulosicoccus sp.]|jgi:3-methyladenine DNA glycosylase AlkC